MPEIDHIGYAVRNVDEKKDLMENLFGFRFQERLEKDRPGNHARLDFYETPGGVMELVENSSPESPINKFIDERGEGLHHICFRVDDLPATMAEWEAKGVKFLMKPPIAGSKNAAITFTVPATTGGITIELLQRLPEGEVPDWVAK
ncbi:MAG: VOC family protein [bacterium]|nr:VOC family protein [bacterium]